MANFPTEQDDDIDGTANADTINSLGGNDRIDGGDGNDDLDGGAGNDTLNGEGGDDTLRVSGSGNDTAHGGAGSDTLFLSWSNAVAAVIDNNAPSTDGINGGFTGGYYNYSDGSSVVYYGIERFVIASGSGNDTITTATGNDIVNSGSGDDAVNVGSGVDQADGGDGVDGLSADLSALAGAVGWNLQTDTYSGPAGTSFAGFEYLGTLRTGGGDDSIVTTALQRNETIHTNAGNDTVAVAGGSDTVHAGTGSDTLIVDYGSATASVIDNNAPSDDGINGGFFGGYHNYTDGSSVTYTGVERFVVTTGSGNDTITTATGNDVVNTGGGDDFVNVATGTDQADGGTGDDGISADMSGASGAIGWNLQSNLYSGPAGTSFVNFEYFGTVKTGGGDDTIVTTGLAKNENIQTGAGNDRITVVAGSDSVAAGTGTDTLVVDYGSATQQVIDNGAPAVDGVNGGFSGGYYDYTNGRQVTYSGVEHFVVTTGGGGDTITTATGNDVVNTGGGDDLVNVGTGTDQADGGAGNDGISVDMALATAAVIWNLTTNIYVGPAGTSFTNFEYFGTLRTGGGDDDIVTAAVFANETIQTGAGNDFIVVRSGSDTVQAGTGFDTLVVDYSAATAAVIDNGAPSVDGTNGGYSGGYFNYTDGGQVNYSGVERFVIRTGSGADIITGAGFDDFIDTFGGNDTVNGGGGSDRIDGGAGNDSLNGGDGRDLVSYQSATSAVTVSLASTGAQDTLGAGVDTLSNFEDLLGSDHDDTLTGDAFSNFIQGGAGADTMSGGGGNDFYLVTEAGDDVVEAAGEGTDEVRTTLGTYTLTANVENLTFVGAGSFNGFGNSLNNVVTGSIGNDAFLLFDGGNDTANGEDGNDFIYYGAALTAADINRGGNGTDTVALLGDYNLTLGSQTLVNVERLVLYSGSQIAGPSVDYAITTIDANVAAGSLLTVNAPSLLADETLVFNGGAETDGRFYVQAGAAADTLVGGQQDDVLRGGAGDDQLFGLAGKDRLAGGLGADALRGGAGNDRFVYEGVLESTAAARDTILDFEKGQDRIDLSAIDAVSGSVANEAFTFIGSAAFGNVAGQLRAYNSAGNQWIVEADVDGNGVADLVIAVQSIGNQPLTGTDFVL